MGAKTDKIFGRARQALGALTGNRKMKRRGHLQEDKGEIKGKFDSTMNKTQETLEDLKNTVNRT